jgi:hypothetical protein
LQQHPDGHLIVHHQNVLAGSPAAPDFSGGRFLRRDRRLPIEIGFNYIFK